MDATAEHSKKEDTRKKTAKRVSEQTGELRKSLEQLHQTTQLSKTAPRKKLKQLPKDSSQIAKDAADILARYYTSDEGMTNSDDEATLHPSNLLRQDPQSPPVEALGSTPSLDESDAELAELMQDIPESSFNQPKLSSKYRSPLPELSSNVPLAIRTFSPLTSSKRSLTPSSVQPSKRAKVNCSPRPSGQENSPRAITRHNFSQKPPERPSPYVRYSSPALITSTSSNTHPRVQARTSTKGSMLVTAPTSSDTSALTYGNGTATNKHASKPVPRDAGHPASIYAAHHNTALTPPSSRCDNDLSSEQCDEDQLEFERWILESVDIVG